MTNSSWSSYGMMVRWLDGCGGIVGGSQGTVLAVHEERDQPKPSPVMPSGAMALVVSLFKSKDSFKEFHLIEDYDDYLEIREDREKYRMENAQRIIGDFCRKYDITDGKEVLRSSALSSELVRSLEEKSQL